MTRTCAKPCGPVGIRPGTHRPWTQHPGTIEPTSVTLLATELSTRERSLYRTSCGGGICAPFEVYSLVSSIPNPWHLVANWRWEHVVLMQNALPKELSTRRRRPPRHQPKGVQA